MALTFRGMTLQRIAYLESKKLRKRVTDKKNRLTRPSFGPPSFYQSLEYRRAYWSALVDIHGVDVELYPEFSKLKGRSIAESVGVPTPHLLDGPISLDELTPELYGNDFVIKPNWGAASRGVLVLSKQDDGNFRELITGAVIAFQDIHTEVRQRMSTSRRGTTSDLIVETSVAESYSRPQEWKIFTFNGDVGLVQQMERGEGETAMKLYDAQGIDVGVLRKDVRINPDLELSKSFEQLVTYASELSLQVPTGFLRIDFFERENGEIVFGELCLIPGGDLYFRRGWDQILGQKWFDANIRLMSDKKELIP